jgi:alcohol dehydrogenase class IV
MNKAFEFATAGRIVFGVGRLNEVGTIAREFGRRVLLVTGGNSSRAEPVRERLIKSGCEVETFAVPGEPTIEMAERAVLQGREARCEVVIGFGGGSVIDAAKAAAALATNPGPALDYLEVIGAGRPLVCDPLPYIAVPTTAGTGAEVTRNAVLHSPADRMKVSLRSPRMLPRVALVDPDTLLTLPDDVMTSTGMDALTQLIEAFVSCRANPLTDALCRQALPRIARSLERAIQNREDALAQTDLAFASLCSGMALANAGLGAVHGLAAPLGGMFAAPHGAVCAALLLPVLKANLEVAQAESKHADTVGRFSELAGLLTAGGGREPQQVLDWVAGLKESIKVRGLAQLGVDHKEFRRVAERAKDASSMKGNPVSLSVEKLRDVLNAAA